MRDLNDMAVFAEIASMGGISAAAERLAMPKSNISRRLARLEQRLGVRLLERTTRNSRLTPMGEQYAERCRAMLEDARLADELIAQSQAQPSGLLRVSASVLMGQQILVPVVAEYQRKFPAVSVSLELDNHRVNLIEQGIDLAFRVGEIEDSTLVAQSMGEFSLQLFASPEYLRSAVGPLQDPGDLASHACLAMGRFAQPAQWQLQFGKLECEVKLDVAQMVNDFLALKGLAEAGSGIALLPSYIVCNDLIAGRLVPVLPHWSSKPVCLSAVYPSRRGAGASVREFIAIARRAIAADAQRVLNLRSDAKIS